MRDECSVPVVTPESLIEAAIGKVSNQISTLENWSRDIKSKVEPVCSPLPNEITGSKDRVENEVPLVGRLEDLYDRLYNLNSELEGLYNRIEL